jgi:hypothetical protein
LDLNVKATAGVGPALLHQQRMEVMIMDQAIFEKQLSKRIRIRRLALTAVTLVLLTVNIVCFCLLKNSGQLVATGKSFIIAIQDEAISSVCQVFILIFAFVGALLVLSVLLIDLLSSRFKTVYHGPHFITIYRGPLVRSIFVDGVETDRLGFFSFTNVIQTRLPDKVRITVTFSPNIFWLAHISFSDQSTSLEV